MPVTQLSYRKLSSRRSARWQRRELRLPRRRSAVRWWRIVVPVMLAGALFGVGVLAWVSRDLPTAEGVVRRTVPQSTKIYDRTGEHVLYDIHGEEKRTAVELQDIPDSLKHATIAAEDRTFYEHKGFKFTSMVRSLIVNLVKGGRVQGGSTITQQFIKNAIFTNEKLYTRKIKEIILAYQIERKFSKDEILKLYLNEIPYGSNAYGAEAAAQTFFGKPVKDISLAESAVLAALNKGTTYYSPYGNHLDELIGRQHYILDAMAQEEYITQAEADAAKTAKLEFKERRETIEAPHFIFYVRELLAEKYGERTVEQGGLKIVTTLDVEKQRLAEEAVAAQTKANEAYRASNASLVALDVPTNQVLAMVGSRDYFNDDIAGQVNVSTRPRQPGSSFKPVVYAAALELGFTPETLLFDVDTVFKTDTTDYEPHNYDLKEHGLVSLRQALAGSLNIPAVKLLYLTGIDRVLQLARDLGYTTLQDRSRFGLSLVLGGAEVKLLEHTSAYAALAREGTAKPTVSVLRVENSRGDVLEEFKDSPGRRVLTEQTAREVASIMSDNEARAFIFGSQNRLTLPDRPVAAKTGTTNDYHDAWTLGFTPDLAVGVWVGNSDNSEMKRGADGSIIAAPIWQSFFVKAVAGTPIKSFTAPEPRTVDRPMLNGSLGGEVVDVDIASGRLATDLTPPEYRAKRLFKQYHTILKYVAPGDPLGPAPEFPERDRQYETWEAAVRRWAQEQGLIDESPPTEFDPVHTNESKPRVTILSPGPNQTITQNPMPLSVSVLAPRTIERVRYLLDGQEIGTAANSPFSLSFPVTTEWPNGFHTLTAEAYDDVGNRGEAQVTFSLLVTPLPSFHNINFSNLHNGQSLSSQDFPFTLTFERPEGSPLLKQIDVYAQTNDSPSAWLGVIPSPNNTSSFVWTNAAPGAYTLSLTLTSSSNLVRQGPRVTVDVAP